MRPDFTAKMMAVGLCLLVSGLATATTTTGSLESTTGTWRAYRGSGFAILVCSNSSESAMLACVAADAERRAASTRYQLRYPNRYVTVSYTAPICSPPRATETKSATCPVGTTGTFTQTRTWAAAPYPTCEIAGAWLPATPSSTECPPTQTNACVGRVCRLTWSYSGPVAEGFRVVYGRSQTELPGSTQISGGTRTTADITVTASGTWYFAVIAYGGGNDSPLSNIISRTVQ